VASAFAKASAVRRKECRRGLRTAPFFSDVGAPAPLTDAVLALRKDAPRYRLLHAGGFVLFQRVQVVQAPHEQQVRDLLDDLDWIGDAARPESVPNLANLTLDCPGDHELRLYRGESCHVADAMRPAPAAASRINFTGSYGEASP